MNCKDFQISISDAALNTRHAASPQLSAHLASCAACRDELRRRRQLVAAMDRAAIASVAPEPSSGFNARLRRRIAADAESPRFVGLAWRPAVLAAMVLLSVLLVRVAWLRHLNAPIHNADIPSGPSIQPPRPDSGIAPTLPVSPNHPAPLHPVALPVTKKPAPQILISPREWPAVVEFTEHLSNHPAERRFFSSAEAHAALEPPTLTPGPSPVTPPAQTEALNIRPIDIPLLETSPSGQSAPRD